MNVPQSYRKKSLENIVNSGIPVYLTKNGYGAMVVLSLEEYANLNDDIEMKLDEADRQAAMTDESLSHETVFRNVRSAIHGNPTFNIWFERY
ncbi:MAG: type II toxin-antitoxin system Phd/YefM family antitoxin [Roseburia sp.]|nr:type II toxin-antitoxin system Phd/YefM family antitoxin [Roseburia sp.]